MSNIEYNRFCLAIINKYGDKTKYKIPTVKTMRNNGNMERLFNLMLDEPIMWKMKQELEVFLSRHSIVDESLLDKEKLEEFIAPLCREIQNLNHQVNLILLGASVEMVKAICLSSCNTSNNTQLEPSINVMPSL